MPLPGVTKVPIPARAYRVILSDEVTTPCVVEFVSDGDSRGWVHCTKLPMVCYLKTTALGTVNVKSPDTLSDALPLLTASKPAAPLAKPGQDRPVPRLQEVLQGLTRGPKQRTPDMTARDCRALHSTATWRLCNGHFTFNAQSLRALVVPILFRHDTWKGAAQALRELSKGLAQAFYRTNVDVLHIMSPSANETAESRMEALGAVQSFFKPTGEHDGYGVSFEVLANGSSSAVAQRKVVVSRGCVKLWNLDGEPAVSRDVVSRDLQLFLAKSLARRFARDLTGEWMRNVYAAIGDDRVLVAEDDPDDVSMEALEMRAGRFELRRQFRAARRHASVVARGLGRREQVVWDTRLNAVPFDMPLSKLIELTRSQGEHPRPLPACAFDVVDGDAHLKFNNGRPDLVRFMATMTRKQMEAEMVRRGGDRVDKHEIDYFHKNAFKGSRLCGGGPYCRYMSSLDPVGECCASMRVDRKLLSKQHDVTQFDVLVAANRAFRAHEAKRGRWHLAVAYDSADAVAGQKRKAGPRSPEEIEQRRQEALRRRALRK